MRQLLLISALLVLPQIGRAQPAADLVSWSWAGARLQPDSSRWTLEATAHYVAYQQLTRTFLRLGRGSARYTWPRSHLFLELVYAAGSIDRRGTSQLGQFRFGQELSAWALQPRWQLTLDRLWLTPQRYDGRLRDPTHRVRTRVGIMPRLSPHLSLVLNTEPFLYRTGYWLTDVRSQAGLQWQPASRLMVQALYWNWWAGYETRRVNWQHTILLTSTVLFK